MTADTKPEELARFTDAQGHRITAEVTRSGLLVILTATPAKSPDGRPSKGRPPALGGHPALNRENVVELRNALTEYLARDSP